MEWSPHQAQSRFVLDAGLANQAGQQGWATGGLSHLYQGWSHMGLASKGWPQWGLVTGSCYGMRDWAGEMGLSSGAGKHGAGKHGLAHKGLANVGGQVLSCHAWGGERLVYRAGSWGW